MRDGVNVRRVLPAVSVWGRARTGSPIGFTLVEVLVVLAIVAVLLGLGLPSYVNYGSNQRLRAAARTVASDLRAARGEAIKRRAAVHVSFTQADGGCPGAGGAGSYTITPPGGPSKRACLPRHVVWVSIPQRALVFQSTGGVAISMVVRLQSTRTGETHAVFVAAETGVVTHDTP